jgi:hypothetical protein
MKFLVLLAVAIVGVSCLNIFDVTLNEDWELYKTQHIKEYKNKDEESLRYVKNQLINNKILFFFHCQLIDV